MLKISKIVVVIWKILKSRIFWSNLSKFRRLWSKTQEFGHNLKNMGKFSVKISKMLVIISNCLNLKYFGQSLKNFGKNIKEFGQNFEDFGRTLKDYS